MLLQNLCGGFQVGSLVRGDDVVLRHHLVDALVQVALEAQVAIGHDAHQVASVVHHGDAADLILGHQRQGVRHGRTALDGDRVINHAVLRTLHDGHLAGLFLDGHVLMDHADAALARDGDSHLGFGHRIHGSRHKRNLQLDVA